MEIDMTYPESSSIHTGLEKSQTDLSPELVGANKLIGLKVNNALEEHLGDIKELMLDMRTGKVAYAAIASGGVFTLGEKLVAVPWNALKHDAENNMFILDIGKERFEKAVSFDSDHWPNMVDKSWVDAIHTYYGMSASDYGTH